MITNHAYEGGYLVVNPTLLKGDEAQSYILQIMDSLKEIEEIVLSKEGSIKHKEQMLLFTKLCYGIMLQVVSSALNNDLEASEEILCEKGFSPLLKEVAILKKHLRALDMELASLCLDRSSVLRVITVLSYFAKKYHDEVKVSPCLSRGYSNKLLLSPQKERAIALLSTLGIDFLYGADPYYFGAMSIFAPIIRCKIHMDLDNGADSEGRLVNLKEFYQVRGIDCYTGEMINN